MNSRSNLNQGIVAHIQCALLSDSAPFKGAVIANIHNASTYIITAITVAARMQTWHSSGWQPFIFTLEWTIHVKPSISHAWFKHCFGEVKKTCDECSKPTSGAKTLELLKIDLQYTPSRISRQSNYSSVGDIFSGVGNYHALRPQVSSVRRRAQCT